jgi:hypothetical protein
LSLKSPFSLPVFLQWLAGFCNSDFWLFTAVAQCVGSAFWVRPRRRMQISLHLANVAESIFRALNTGGCREVGWVGADVIASGSEQCVCVWGGGGDVNKETDIHPSKRLPSILPDEFNMKMVATSLTKALEKVYSCMRLKPESWSQAMFL